MTMQRWFKPDRCVMKLGAVTKLGEEIMYWKKLENRPCLDLMNIGRWLDQLHIYVYIIYSSYLTSCSIEKGEEKTNILTNWLTLSTGLIILFFPFENSVKLGLKKSWLVELALFFHSLLLQNWPSLLILHVTWHFPSHSPAFQQRSLSLTPKNGL